LCEGLCPAAGAPASRPPPPSPRLSSREPVDLRVVVRLAPVELGGLEFPPVELGAVVVLGAGAGCGTLASLGVADFAPVDVVLCRAGADRLRVVVRRDVLGSATVGARLRPPEIGSEESPMCWLVSWLVAHVMPAVSTSPSSAASAHRAVCRLIRAP
jgi:hypothetical protein